MIPGRPRRAVLVWRHYLSDPFWGHYMQRRILMRVSLVAIAAMTPALTTTIGVNAAQPTGKAAGLNRLSIPAGLKYVPAMARNDHRQVGVIFTLKGSSVGAQVADARAHGRSLSSSDRSALRKQVASSQQSTVAHVRSVGGTVDYTYQDAYNGFAAKVPASSLGALAADPDVAAVHVTHTLSLNDVSGNQYVGAPAAWNKGAPETRMTGKGVKIAIIDTGVDYTHADFGGAGTEAAFKNNNGAVVEPGSFPTAKVVGGRDYVGDAYNAGDPKHNVPQPDPDPLDCNGHGSHVAGIAAGEGVLSDGSTYTGPYDNTTFNHSFKVGPGIAPEASILAYRVFGCSGTVDNSIVVAALNQAMIDGANVVNMSLGSPFGRADDPEVATVDQLSAAGVTVVASAGNNGTNAYLIGAPAAADSAIAVAAMDATSPTVPGAHTTGTELSRALNMQLSNDVDFTEGRALTVKVLRNADGSVSLGCDPAEYTKAGVTGELVVVQRGTCGRVDRAIYGQQAGAAAVAMIDSTTGYPPVEGKITENPDTGAKFTVTIPFFGVQGIAGTGNSDGDVLAADNGNTVTLTHIGIANPGYGKFASFTSGGPRNGDSAVKPDVTAPGVSVLSAGVGTGSGPATISGTSQASPATAGVAALVKQAHPSWTPEQIKAAIVSTANPSLVTGGYDVRIGGTGVVQPARAVDSAVLPLTDHSRSSLTFGYHPASGAWSQTLPFTLQNTSGDAVTYDVTTRL